MKKEDTIKKDKNSRRKSSSVPLRIAYTSQGCRCYFSHDKLVELGFKEDGSKGLHGQYMTVTYVEHDNQKFLRVYPHTKGTDKFRLSGQAGKEIVYSNEIGRLVAEKIGIDIENERRPSIRLCDGEIAQDEEKDACFEISLDNLK